MKHKFALAKRYGSGSQLMAHVPLGVVRRPREALRPTDEIWVQIFNLIFLEFSPGL